MAPVARADCVVLCVSDGAVPAAVSGICSVVDLLSVPAVFVFI